MRCFQKALVIILNSVMQKVSIIIPVYNRPDLLKEALESILAQSYKNIEVVLIDDNSDEVNYGEWLSEFNNLDFQYYKNVTNRGATACRNKGIELATGAYISFLDSDDIILPLKIEKLLKEAVNSRADYIYAGWKWKNFETSEIRKRRLPDSKGFIEGLPRWCYNIVPELVRGEVAKKECFHPEIKSYELFDFVIRMFKDYKVSYVPEILSVFRDHSGPRNSSNKEARIKSVDFIFEKHKAFILSQKEFASNLKLSQGIYNYDTIRNGFSKNFIEAIKINPLNFRAYYHYFKTITQIG